MSKNILFAATEAFPFANTGALGEVLGSLPKAVNREKGMDVRVILPLYETIPQEYKDRMEFLCNIYVPVAWRNQYCGLFSLEHNGLTFYFVDNEYYFKRPNFYGYYDDAERFGFFSRAVLELLPHIDFAPDVIHSNDWQTALIPVYFNYYYKYREGFSKIKNVFTIHSIEYQGVFPKPILEDVFGISDSRYSELEHNGNINLMKAAIVFCDAVTTVSPTYAKEILLPVCGNGLDTVLIKYVKKLKGILNGIDTDYYDPAANEALFKNYNRDTLDYKAENKVELQRMLSLPEGKNIPVVAIVSRLAAHKGLDLVRQSINTIMPDNSTLNNNIQFIILGKGEQDYEGYFTHIQNMYDRRFRTIIAYNKDLAQKIFAAADIYLMPSKSEPSGLSQMISCRYGVIPVVRATGGLIDSITDCGDGSGGNGFVFENYDAYQMTDALERAVSLYYNSPEKWRALQKRATKCDFSWNNSAKEYIRIYSNI